MPVDYQAKLVVPIFNRFAEDATYTPMGGSATTIQVVFRQSVELFPDDGGLIVSDLEDVAYTQAIQTPTLRNGDTFLIRSVLYEFSKLVRDDGFIKQIVLFDGS